MIAKRIKRERTSSFQRLSAYITSQPEMPQDSELQRTVDYITDHGEDQELVSDRIEDLGIPGMIVSVDPAELDRLGLVDEGAAGLALAEPRRVGAVRVTNCHDVDVAGATAEILAVQARNTRSKADKTYHLVFSFPAGEVPSGPQLVDIEQMLCAAIGLADHQRISAVHHDTENLHVHVAINKVHPTTFRNVEPYFDMPKLQEACIAAEIKHGLERTNHGHEAERRAARKALPEGAPAQHEEFLVWVRERAAPILERSTSWEEANRDLGAVGLEIRPRGAGAVVGAPDSSIVVKASDISRRFSLQRLERRWGAWSDSHPPQLPTLDNGGERPPASQGAEGMEVHAGRESALTWMKREVPAIVADASTWAELHERLASIGVEVQRRKAGVVFSVSQNDSTVKGSQLAESCKGSSLLEKFGAWQSASAQPGDEVTPGAAEKSYGAEPLHRHAESRALFDDFQEARREALERRTQARASLQERTNAYRAELSDWYAKRRESIRNRGGLTRAGKDAELAALERERADEFAQYRGVAAQQRKAVTAASPLPTWSEFLQQRAAAGDTVALAVLRSKTTSARQFAADFLMAASPSEARHIVLPRLAPKVSKWGTVIYQTRDGGSVKDQAKTVDIQQGSLGASALAVVLASEKFKGVPLKVAGADTFKRQVAQAAAVCGLDVTFEDAALDAVRRQYRAGRDLVAAGGGVVSPDLENFGLPGVQVELSADLAARLGLVTETALTPEDSWDARNPAPLEAVSAYIQERNGKRAAMLDISYHRPWEPKDAGPVVYQGRRRLSGGTEAVLLGKGDETLVKVVSAAQMAKASKFAVGSTVHVDGQGRFVAAQTRRKR